MESPFNHLSRPSAPASPPVPDLPTAPIWQRDVAPAAPPFALTDRPQWPSQPPPAGGYPASTPAPAHPPRRRRARAAGAVLAATAIATSAFFVGTSVGTSETTMVPVAAPDQVSAPAETRAAEQPTVAAPSPVTPQAVPTVPAPILPPNSADEPVAAAASVVAPAVVLLQNQLGQGSGIVYDASGLILTNAHVVGQFSDLQVTLASGVTVPGQVLGADPNTDVAVVKIDTDAEFGVAALAPLSSVQVGQLAIAIGSPFGLEQTVTSGVVSAIGRVLENPLDDGSFSIVSMIQTDAPINPGNSGGALADRQGRVIGMNTSIRTDATGGNIGVGFAIPADTARLIADRIVAGEPLEQGFLGIGRGDTPLLGTPGVVIGSVIEGSGAEAAGLQVGDLITSYNGAPIKGMADLAAAVRLSSPNDVVTVEFQRDGETLVVDVTLGVNNGQ